jgi:hypothetical protein
MNGYLQLKCRSEQQLMIELTKLVSTKDFTSKKMSELINELAFFYVSPHFSHQLPHTVLKDLSILLMNLKDKKEDLRLAKMVLCFLTRIVEQFEPMYQLQQQTSSRTQSFEFSANMTTNLFKQMETNELNHSSLPRQVTCLKLYAHLCRLFQKNDLLLNKMKPLVQKSPIWAMIADKKKTRKEFPALIAALGAAFHSIRFHLNPMEQEHVLESMIQAAFLPSCVASRHAAASLLKLFDTIPEKIMKTVHFYLLKFKPTSILVGDTLGTIHLIRLCGKIARLPIAPEGEEAAKAQETSTTITPAPVATNLLDFSFDEPVVAAAPPTKKKTVRPQGPKVDASVAVRLRDFLLDIVCASETLPKPVVLAALEEVNKEQSALACFEKSRGGNCIFDLTAIAITKMIKEQEAAMLAQEPGALVLLHRLCRIAQFAAQSLDSAVLQLTTGTSHEQTFVEPVFFEKVTEKMTELAGHSNEFIARESLIALIWLLPRKLSTKQAITLWKVKLLPRLQELGSVHPTRRHGILQALYQRAIAAPSSEEQDCPADVQMLKRSLQIGSTWFQAFPCVWQGEMLCAIWRVALEKCFQAMSTDVFQSIFAILDYHRPPSATSSNSSSNSSHQQHDQSMHVVQEALQEQGGHEAAIRAVQHMTLNFLCQIGSKFAAYTAIQQQQQPQTSSNPTQVNQLVMRLLKCALLCDYASRRLSIQALAQIGRAAQQFGNIQLHQQIQSLFQTIWHQLQLTEEDSSHFFLGLEDLIQQFLQTTTPSTTFTSTSTTTTIQATTTKFNSGSFSSTTPTSSDSFF